jgi:hypothetical protein
MTCIIAAADRLDWFIECLSNTLLIFYKFCPG